MKRILAVLMMAAAAMFAAAVLTAGAGMSPMHSVAGSVSTSASATEY